MYVRTKSPYSTGHRPLRGRCPKRERERKRETDRQTDRQKNRQTEAERVMENERFQHSGMQMEFQTFSFFFVFLAKTIWQLKE